MNLERIYSKIPNNPLDSEKWFISNFQNMFQYSVFLKDSSEGSRSMSIRFLENKIRFLKENNIRTDFICQEIKFGKHDFSHCSFRKCLLIGCDFENCDIRGVDFSFASLQNADLSKAIIDKTTKFTNAKLNHTKITKKQIQFFNDQSENELLIVDNNDENLVN